MPNPTVRELICEAVTDGLSPELAVNMLLEPSKWQEKLFDPARDLATVYKQYLRGELGVGVLSDAVNRVLASSNDMADLADTVVQTYGTDATPEDVPEESEVGDIAVEDEQVEVLVQDEDDFVARIIEHVRSNWPRQVLEDLYGDRLTEQDVGQVQRAGSMLSPASTGITQMHPGLGRGAPEPHPSMPQPKRTQYMMPSEKINPETLQAFEQGKMLNNIYSSAFKLITARKQIAKLYKSQKWGELAQVYQPGGALDLQLGYLAGDLMVLKDTADAAVKAGFGARRIGGVDHMAGLPATEAWQPALLDPEIGEQVGKLVQALVGAKRGQMTYQQLQQQIDPLASPSSVFFKLSRRGQKQGPYSTPFTSDQARIQRMVTAGAQAPPGAPPEPLVAPELQDRPADATQAVEPLQTAAGVLQGLQGEETGDLPAPPPEEPAPVAPAPETKKAVAAAATGEDPDLGAILGGEGGAEDEPIETSFKKVMGLAPDRAKQFSQWLRKSGKDPAEIVKKVQDSYAVMQQLGLLPGGWSKFAKKNPEDAAKVQRVMNQLIRKQLEAGKDIEVVELLKIGTKLLSSAGVSSARAPAKG